jgi:hypothetical protein
MNKDISYFKNTDEIIIKSETLFEYFLFFQKENFFLKNKNKINVFK